MLYCDSRTRSFIDWIVSGRTRSEVGGRTNEYGTRLQPRTDAFFSVVSTSFVFVGRRLTDCGLCLAGDEVWLAHDLGALSPYVGSKVCKCPYKCLIGTDCVGTGRGVSPSRGEQRSRSGRWAGR